jgi:hypothetical protein
MMIAWKSFLLRRGITLEDIVKAHDLNYEGLCSYFAQRGASTPPRDNIQVEKLFGREEVAPPKEATSAPKPVAKPAKKPRLIDASIKNTKKELLQISSKLGLKDVSDRMTKSKILSALESTGKVRILSVSTTKGKK